MSLKVPSVWSIAPTGMLRTSTLEQIDNHHLVACGSSYTEIQEKIECMIPKKSFSDKTLNYYTETLLLNIGKEQ